MTFQFVVNNSVLYLSEPYNVEYLKKSIQYYLNNNYKQYVIQFDPQYYNNYNIYDFLQNNMKDVTANRYFLENFYNGQYFCIVVFYHYQNICIEYFADQGQILFLKLALYNAGRTINCAEYNIFPSTLNYFSQLLNIFLNGQAETYMIKLELAYISPTLTASQVMVRQVYKQMQDFYGNTYNNLLYMYLYEYCMKYKQFLEYQNADGDETVTEVKLPEKIEITNVNEINYNTVQEKQTEEPQEKRKRRKKKAPQIQEQQSATIPQDVADVFVDYVVNMIVFSDQKVCKFNLSGHDFEFCRYYVLGADDSINKVNQEFLIGLLQPQLKYGDVASVIMEGQNLVLQVVMQK